MNVITEHPCHYCAKPVNGLAGSYPPGKTPFLFTPGPGLKYAVAHKECYEAAADLAA